MRYGVLRHSADAPHPTHAPYRQATLDAAFAGPACFNLRYVLGDEGLAIPRRGAHLRLPVASGANYVAGLRPVALGGATYFGFAASTLDVPGNATFVYTSGTPVGLVADAGLFDATSVTLVQTNMHGRRLVLSGYPIFNAKAEVALHASPSMVSQFVTGEAWLAKQWILG